MYSIADTSEQNRAISRNQLGGWLDTRFCYITAVFLRPSLRLSL
jgi:hypothetical protein